MVHALDEVRRVLIPRGLLIDLRPLDDRWPVQMVAGKRVEQVGRMADHEIGLADDQASNGAIDQARANGWFQQEEQVIFPFFYYWDTPSEMKQHIDEEWSDWNVLEADTFRAAGAAWASGGPEARVRVQLKMVITRWRKLPAG